MKISVAMAWTKRLKSSFGVFLVFPFQTPAPPMRPGKRHAVATGFAFAIPDGYEVQVRPRSGLALKHGITCLNTPGTIDSDYRGEVKVILANLGDEDFVINTGDRIAQIVVAPVTQGVMVEVDALDDTERGTGGFGSTGV